MLRPGGRPAAVLHHVDALPVRIAHEECAHIDFLLEDDGLLARAQTLIEPLASAATTEGRDALRSDAAANAARGAFNEALRAIKERVAGARHPDALDRAAEYLMQLRPPCLTSARRPASSIWTTCAMPCARHACASKNFRRPRSTRPVCALWSMPSAAASTGWIPALRERGNRRLGAGRDARLGRPPAAPMTRQKSAYVCTQCGATASKWQGQCPGCEQWNT